jgi:predicted O-methyltransferase YrrM
MLRSLIRAFVPWPVKEWRRRSLVREKAAGLAALRAPQANFAEMYRAARESGWFTTLQVEAEIVGLLEEVARRQCQTLLEIGTASGGTMFLLTRAASRHATLVTLDLEKDSLRWECYQQFALDQQRIVCLQGNSNSPDCKKQVEALLAGRPLDFLLIDGDHSAYGVRTDYRLYRPLVAPGGLVAFHDICLEGGVKEFWAEIKAGHEHRELIADPTQGQCGLGLLYV